MDGITRSRVSPLFLLALILWTGTATAKESDENVPWPHQYKIRPDQKDRLTAADVVGPDGIVYPNWTQCGVQGGIPTVKSRGEHRRLRRQGER